MPKMSRTNAPLMRGTIIRTPDRKPGGEAETPLNGSLNIAGTCMRVACYYHFHKEHNNTMYKNTNYLNYLNDKYTTTVSQKVYLYVTCTSVSGLQDFEIFGIMILDLHLDLLVWFRKLL